METKAFELASKEGRRPTWEMALLYPDQGSWTEDDYLGLDIGRHVEFCTGSLEFQPMPDEKHQAIVFFFIQALKAFASVAGGKATLAPFPMRLWEEKYREPDVLFMKGGHVSRCRGKFWDGADIVIEVLSESNRDEDLVTKRGEYAKAKIPEYWIVDYENRRITVLVLQDQAYIVHGEFGDGQAATSRVLQDFQVQVTTVLEAE